MLVACLALLAGAGAAVAVLLLTGWRQTPLHQYEVTVVLKAGISVEQREELGLALESVVSGEGVRLISREEQFDSFRADWESRNGALPTSVTPAAMREQLQVSSRRRVLSCDTLAGLRDDARVDDLLVARFVGDKGPKTWVVC